MISICRVMIFIVTACKTEFSLAGRRVKKYLYSKKNLRSNCKWQSLDFWPKEQKLLGKNPVYYAKLLCIATTAMQCFFFKDIFTYIIIC